MFKSQYLKISNSFQNLPMLRSSFDIIIMCKPNQTWQRAKCSRQQHNREEKSTTNCYAKNRKYQINYGSNYKFIMTCRRKDERSECWEDSQNKIVCIMIIYMITNEDAQRNKSTLKKVLPVVG